MTTYIETIGQRYNAQSHHSFILHGATRDLQLGNAGSCSLVDHMIQTFGQSDRLVAVYRVGIGWKFALDSDKAEFCALVGLDSGANNDYAGLGVQSETELPLDTSAAIGLLDIAMRQSDKPVLMVIDRAELVCANSSYDRMTAQDKAVLSILQALAADRAVESTGNMLVLVTDSLLDLAESLRVASGRYYAVEILPPDYTERLAIADQVFPQLESAGISIEMSAPEFAQASSMMTRYGLMDIMLDAKASGSLTRLQVRQVKQQVLSQEYGDVLETLEPIANGFTAIAGLQTLKDFFRDTVIDNMVAGNLADVPAGLLLAGAAGLGKSYFMRGVAAESGLPVINFNVGRLLGSFVGQSERNLERALTAIRSAAPCIVVLDEIETTFPDRSSAAPAGDSGIGQRILKRMLEVLSDPGLRGKVVWVGITNFPQKLDAALSRAGRFDLTVAFLPPTELERGQLIELYASKYDVPLPTFGSTLESLARSLVGYTNAEIENVVRKARQLIRVCDGLDAAWLESVKRVRANTRDVQSMTDAALQAVNDSDLLPTEYIDRWRRVTGQTDQDTERQAPERQARKQLF